jgi:hypothetical protein
MVLLRKDDVVDRDSMVCAVARQEKHTSLLRFGPCERHNTLCPVMVFGIETRLQAVDYENGGLRVR